MLEPKERECRLVDLSQAVQAGLKLDAVAQNTVAGRRPCSPQYRGRRKERRGEEGDWTVGTGRENS